MIFILLCRLWTPIGRQYSLVMCPLPPSSIPYDWSMILFSVVPGHKGTLSLSLRPLCTILVGCKLSFSLPPCSGNAC